jgi:hypothetical protein
VYDNFFSVTYMKILGEAFVPEFSLVLNLLREGLGIVEAGRPFQSRNVQGEQTI